MPVHSLSEESDKSAESSSSPADEEPSSAIGGSSEPSSVSLTASNAPRVGLLDFNFIKVLGKGSFGKVTGEIFSVL